MYFRRDVLFNEHSMPFWDARQLIAHTQGDTAHLRRGIAQFTRSVFRDDNDDLNLDIYDENGDPESPLQNLGAANWLPVHDHVTSPLQVGDTLFVNDHPTKITSVSPQQILAKDLLSKSIHIVGPTGQFFHDTSGLLTSARRSTRFRSQSAYFTYNSFGGEVERKKPKTIDLGEDLVGMDFWDHETKDPESAMHLYTVTKAAKHVDNGKTWDCLEYKPANAVHDDTVTTDYSKV